jgi:hypothetical protein
MRHLDLQYASFVLHHRRQNLQRSVQANDVRRATAMNEHLNGDSAGYREVHPLHRLG